jgi:hypothetical protein
MSQHGRQYKSIPHPIKNPPQFAVTPLLCTESLLVGDISTALKHRYLITEFALNAQL